MARAMEAVASSTENVADHVIARGRFSFFEFLEEQIGAPLAFARALAEYAPWKSRISRP